MTLTTFTDTAITGLDSWLNRVTRRDATLRLEGEPGLWAVSDSANDDEVMIRGHSLAATVNWMRAFVAQHPGSTVDEASVEASRELGALSFGHSVRAPLLTVVEA